MKIKKEQLQRIIKEELDSVLSEGPLDKFLRRRKIKKQGGYEWDDFSPEQKDSLRRAMDFEDPDMAKADLEISKKQAREKVQADLEDFKNQRDAKKKAEEEARRRTQERARALGRLFVNVVGPPLELAYLFGQVSLTMGILLSPVIVPMFAYSYHTIHSPWAKKAKAAAEKEARFQQARQNLIRKRNQLAQQKQAELDRLDRQKQAQLDREAWEQRIGPIAIEVEKMSKEEIYEKIKNITPKHGKPIPEFYKRAVAEQVSEMSVIEIEQVLKDERTIKLAFKKFEINPAEDLKIKKDDSIYK